MKKLTPALALALAVAAPTYADTVFGVYMGAGSFNFDTAGNFTDLQDFGTEIDLENDLGLSGDSGTYFYIALEHGVPVLPNLRISHTILEESADATLTKDIVYDGIPFLASTQLSTDVDLTHTDITFYYEILDNWFNLDAGLTARTFSGRIESTETSGSNMSAKVDLDFTIPLFYLKTQIDLPLTGVYVGADINWIGYNGSQFYDVWARLGYEFAFGLGVEAGYRKLQLKLDDISDLDADMTVDGNYISATYHF